MSLGRQFLYHKVTQKQHILFPFISRLIINSDDELTMRTPSARECRDGERRESDGRTLEGHAFHTNGLILSAEFCTLSFEKTS